eukprot:4046626-Prymnesium_polylepis.1
MMDGKAGNAFSRPTAKAIVHQVDYGTTRVNLDPEISATRHGKVHRQTLLDLCHAFYLVS